eukprot:TRINITY_DN6871_c0_g1_i1.p1 TRINITY_DN6871_c0_g1~~TRINITY_DN6871_c0_g1_i1.p1  ORF type:complete len:359 (+),score=103.19 TRINITY_DN6871_c0_g1_i1:34-1110(+)
MEDYQKEIAFIRSNLPGWKDLKDEDIQFHQYHSGMSRGTFRVSSKIPSVSPNPIILRKFRGNPQPDELENFQRMSDSNIGPKLFVPFDPQFGLRIEQYFEHRVMKHYEINQKKYRRQLANRLALFHALKIEAEKPRRSYIDTALERWLKGARDNCEKGQTEEHKQISKNLAYLFSDEEIGFVQKTIEKMPLVWSHNDIWTGNLLITLPEEQVLLVDYEVSNFNFRGYDIGKLLMEVLYQRHEGKTTYDFLSFEHLPSKEDTVDFLKAYIVTANGYTIKNYEDDNELEVAFQSISDREDQMKELLREVDVGIMIAGFYSALLGMWVGTNITALDFYVFARDGESAYSEFKKRLSSSLSQ